MKRRPAFSLSYSHDTPSPTFVATFPSAERVPTQRRDRFDRLERPLKKRLEALRILAEAETIDAERAQAIARS